MFIVIGVCLLGLLSCKKDPDPEPEGFTVVKYSPVDVPKGNPMQIFVHYMPWFEDNVSSGNGSWGMHWTMATMDPDVVTDGKREIASYFYPLIGPYASGDAGLIEYHLLLMKYSGISGILIDWYGSSDANDYASIRNNTENLISHLNKVGLDFAIVYEDRTIDAVLEQTEETDAVNAARADIQYLEDNYFSNNHYIKINGKPLLMVFGPEKFHTPGQWSNILSVLTVDPTLLILNGNSSQTAPNSSGEYIWVNTTSLDYWYATASKFDYFMGGAYPGFKDFYLEGGWSTGLGWEISYNSGTTFAQGLEKAAQKSMDYLQLITWNDFGEGTMIEPTLEFGYTFLDAVQKFAEVEYDSTELEYIHTLYNLRKDNEGVSDRQKLLDQSFYYLVSLQTDKAINILDSLSGQ